MSYPEQIRLKEQASKAIIPTQLIFHSLANGWNFDAGVGWLVDPGNPLESHIAVRKDGLRVQLVDYRQRAEANYHANRRPDGTGALSAETDSSVDATEPWTDDQVASLIEWAVARCREFGIPARLCTSPSDPGIGWHIMWGSPGEWTPVSKSCPGPARIEQVKNVIVPAVARILAGGTANPTTPTAPVTEPESPQEDDMSQAQYDEIITRLDRIEKSAKDDRRYMNELPKRVDDVDTANQQAINGVRTILDRILKKLGA